MAKSLNNERLDRWKDPYFDINLAKKVEKQDSTVGAYIITLCKFGVCGIGHISGESVMRVLDKNNLHYATNDRGMLWLTSLKNEDLKKVFSKKYKPITRRK